ncbi:double-strand break repair helicase AddA [Flaviflagellibacter deserti]|uniref:DNA 3'-5' helicase n=1 Tax=Flaviflagellibacter deserti TaxID=2267266 RepID=A0ABV9YXQ5_9HYPH
MNERLQPTQLTQERQRRASDPGASAWVAANAGSGKTRVLSNRVIRLLLHDVEPSKILCLTFTKAAAANMSNRVFGVLSEWATASDEALDKALRDIGEPAGSPSLRRRARRLFARALETPGGLKVLTIHAFCESVLHQFPFEAGVPAAFTVLDDRQQAELVAVARHDMLSRAADGDGPIGRALSRLIVETSDGSLAKALDAVLRDGEGLTELMRPNGEDASARVSRRLALALGLGDNENCETINARVLDEAIEIASWSEIIFWLSGGGPNDNKLADCFRAAQAASDDDARRAVYLGLCLTKGKTLRSRNALVTKALRASRPDLAQRIDDEFERLAGLLERRNAATVRERTEALLTIADAIWHQYTVEKARRGALDFSDLITKTGALIRNAGAAWVHFKLDQGIDHVLIDEAQDTSPEQWEIVRGLTQEFTAGQGARNVVRTVFAVGDEKQSIFGFQGAAPQEFVGTRRFYSTAYQAAGMDFHAVELTQSFRSTADVLGAVDLVFAQPAAYRGLSFDEVETVHETARPDAPGRVDLWPLVLADERVDSDRAWDAPFDAVSERSPVARLADRIATSVQGWIAGRDVAGPCTPVPPGEILVLVRSRGTLFEAILRALKNAGVPVAGADRLDVGKHIAVLDLLALADAVLLAEDDLALACVLKSPLFGFDDDDLMRLAPGRIGSLRQALRISAEAKFAIAGERLDRWTASARHLRPFDFYAAILGAESGRRDFRARLGGEVDDVLDEFLRLAMTYGETETATLSGFAAWMREAPAVIKRDLDTGGSEVRVMTVHGAKGLEARLVVLADLGKPRAASLAPAVFHVDDLPLWAGKKADDPPALQAAREAEDIREQGEHRRLLYVAMTRAADRLIVTGHLGDPRKKEAPEGSWYALIRSGLEEVSEPIHVPAFDGDIRIFRKTPERAVAARSAVPEKPAIDLPGWLKRPLAAERPVAEWLAPSRALPHLFEVEVEAAASPARNRGTLLHRLLEELPRLSPNDRTPAAERYLARDAGDWPQADRLALMNEALEIVSDLTLLPLFTGPGRSEVPVAGEIARFGRPPVLVSGRIDRLVIEPERVLILDFKSDRPVPAAPPESYVAQLALYRAVLAKVFPGKVIEAALLWTKTRRLDVLGTNRLDAALDGVLRMHRIP